MTMPRSTEAAEASLTRDLTYAARYYLGGRRGLLILAVLAIVVGLVMNWSWLAAAGIAPILIGVLPCVAMCALGLCMNKIGGKSCSKPANALEAATTSDRTIPPTPADKLEAASGSGDGVPGGVESAVQPIPTRNLTQEKE